MHKFYIHINYEMCARTSIKIFVHFGVHKKLILWLQWMAES